MGIGTLTWFNWTQILCVLGEGRAMVQSLVSYYSEIAHLAPPGENELSRGLSQWCWANLRQHVFPLFFSPPAPAAAPAAPPAPAPAPAPPPP
jgi:hypothetical protein